MAKKKLDINILSYEAYGINKDKREQINTLINTISPLITDSSQAILLGPILAQFVNSGLKNDGNLLKLIEILKKDSKEDTTFTLPADELRDLLDSYDETSSDTSLREV